MTPKPSWITPDESRLYRARSLGNNTFQISSFESMSQPVPSEYTLGDEPTWITDRLMALLLMPDPPPMTTVDGVGTRISSDIFWIIAPETW